jgi:tRNA(Ile2)-agmatinylcytidine synthase
MCTTYLCALVIQRLKDRGFTIEGYPRLIRLNPFARFKTRGNGGVSFKFPKEQFKDHDLNEAKKIILDAVKELAMFDCDNTNPGVVFYDGEITEEMEAFAYKALHSIITIEEAEEFAEHIGAEIHKFKKGRGIIGSIASMSCKLTDHTYELLAYRLKENRGTKRHIDYDSVVRMDKLTDTFENIDGDYLAIEPNTPCPVLYGIRANDPESLKKAQKIVINGEEVERYCIYLTNQHTDMHLEDAKDIASMKQYSSYIVEGFVEDKPHTIEGGHLFFTLGDESGSIECAAYEPTKDFRKIVARLRPKDKVKLYGGIGKENTFNIEKFQVLKLNNIAYRNPKCPDCGKTLSSAGHNKGFKCKHCGYILRDSSKVPYEINRQLKEGKFYETPVSARRHLAKPLVRMNLSD